MLTKNCYLLSLITNRDWKLIKIFEMYKSDIIALYFFPSKVLCNKNDSTYVDTVYFHSTSVRLILRESIFEEQPLESN